MKIETSKMQILTGVLAAGLVATIVALGLFTVHPPPSPPIDLTPDSAPRFFGISEEQVTWTVVLGLIAPLLISALKQTGWPKEISSLVALGVCLIASGLDVWLLGQWDPANIAFTVFLVLVGAQTAYRALFKPSGFDDWWATKTTIERSSINWEAIGHQGRE